MVDFQQKATVLVIDQEVKSEHLKAHVATCLVRTAGLVVADEEGLSSYHGLDDVVFDLVPEGIGLEAHFFEGLEELS